MSDILNTLKKLLALSGSANEAEAALATQKAQALLLKYNLDWSDVEAPAESRKKREKTDLAKSAMYAWQRKLWRKIAETNFCMYWVVERYQGKSVVKRHQVLGSEANVASVVMMGEYLCNTIERILPYPNKERLGRSALSWREGCVDRLAQRLQERHERLQLETMTASNGTEIAVRSIYQREEELNYDSLYGEGAWRAREEQRAARKREWEEALSEMKNQPVEVPPPPKPETEQERKARRKAEERWKAYQERQRRKAEAARNKVDWHAYDRGANAADDINLDQQVAGASKGQLS